MCCMSRKMAGHTEMRLQRISQKGRVRRPGFLDHLFKAPMFLFKPRKFCCYFSSLSSFLPSVSHLISVASLSPFSLMSHHLSVEISSPVTLFLHPFKQCWLSMHTSPGSMAWGEQIWTSIMEGWHSIGTHCTGRAHRLRNQRSSGADFYSGAQRRSGKALEEKTLLEVGL